MYAISDILCCQAQFSNSIYLKDWSYIIMVPWVFDSLKLMLTLMVVSLVNFESISFLKSDIASKIVDHTKSKLVVIICSFYL